MTAPDRFPFFNEVAPPAGAEGWESMELGRVC